MSQSHIMQGVRIRSQQPLRVVGSPVLSAETVSDDEVRLSWIFNNTADADTIEIERSADGETGWTNITSPIAGGSGSYSDTGRTEGTEYFYRARGRIDSSIQGVLLSAYSAVVSATTTDTGGTLTQPTGLAVSESGRTATAWTAVPSWSSVPSATSYDYWFTGGYVSGSSGSPNNQPGTSVAPIAFPRIDADAAADLHVRARNASGAGPEATYPFSIPGNLKAPVLDSVTLSGDDASIAYTENPEADSATGYQIMRNSLSAGYLLLIEKAPGTARPQHIDLNLPTGTHRYQVRARADEATDRFSPLSAEGIVTVSGPPPSGAVAGQDFTLLTDISQLNAGFGGGNLGGSNIYIDPGQGVAVRFVAQPTRCGDQSVGFFLNFAGWSTVWVEFDFVFPTNWTTVNPNCSSPQPDYKHLFFIPKPGPISGRYRADYKTGIGSTGNGIAMVSTGYPGDSAPSMPKNNFPTHVSTPINATQLRDGLSHRYRFRFSFYEEGGAIKEILQGAIDGQKLFSYKDFGNPGFLGRGSVIKQLKLGSNRNLGAIEEMITHWRSIWVYAANPGWPDFAGVGIKDYVDLGGAEYFE